MAQPLGGGDPRPRAASPPRRRRAVIIGSAAEYRALVEDIRQHGQREPIVLYDGRILDGRNRWRACRELGVEPKCIEWTEADGAPSVFVVSRNLHRRHLNEAQRAEIAAAGDAKTRSPSTS
ncbi:MAG TPA: ParB N-terminal domain-containing protein [Stellaceae bacterium]|nr:ParB N-terminal domain-containing protein [Stellaceae bacterium]